MEPGDQMKGLQIQNESHKIHAAYLMSEPQLKRRKTIRHCIKKKQGKNLNKEGTNLRSRRILRMSGCIFYLVYILLWIQVVVFFELQFS